MKPYYFYFIFILCVAALIVVSVRDTGEVRATGDRQDRSAIIKFSHQVHAELLIECVDCHTDAPSSRSSKDFLVAMKADCAMCHDVSNDCQMCHFEDVYVSFEKTEPELYFNHELHFDQLGISCETCHAGIEETDFATAAHMPLKADCMSCHDGGQAAMDCESCHINTGTLLPASHMVADFDREHKRVVRAGAFEAECASCHMQTFCQDCHETAGLLFDQRGFTRTTPMYSPEGAGRRGTSTERVHDLNYKFTHGIDARAKRTQCQTCHEIETFCADCHFDGAGVAPGAFKPASHTQAGFILLGGTGGRHAELARRDLESCMTCHDLQGRDPSCMLCHAQ
jgi:hypothetical protein